ncbi:enoyl-CoA hydratase/isomerase family protein [Sporosarcina sp. P21c]|uniref:enoyl-CoA hydratase/isomerase family protein n=1 Tax=Sporosarcina TaxID=1569 RepID=UPI000A16B9F5|nr:MULTISPECIES: enoyl-CoA hydratase/isomerase family protein [Sporosarcina]ARJ37871.1 hypothetical protein SporoP8_02570 [Sporosarcina ureae]PIC67814.1 enoyl-CoA hydratase/isomerase family protein [Sporosarcina sp. P16a]PIC83807.1 enoyl-CoA hydratase/isomerase family protein [Sporosarcina sp. P1]PIC90673.1 enoyl-CoA hydratase/isomerase family protein [Sporosarcina sp. P21c]PIC93438.1 enoyl-CoA hydratase/isomerase family protein [Sporosarcina sp. P25]
MKYCIIDVSIENEVAQVLLNNGENGNVLNAEMAQELAAIATELSHREDIKVVVLGARGKSFSCWNPQIENPTIEDDLYATIALSNNAIEQWARIPHPVIVAIEGECSSLGLSLACVADVRYASDTAFFSVPESKHGLIPTGGITQRLPRIIGKGPAMSMLLGGEVIQSSEAKQLGLINKIVDKQSVWEAACQEAQELAKLSSLSMQYTKECLLRGSELSFEQALRLELDIYMLLSTSEDRMEGVQAFLEKRPAQFTGK